MGSAGLIGASIVAISRGRCRRLVPWGSQVVSMSGGKRTWRGSLETVAIDPKST
jgi:hypothetical protein